MSNITILHDEAREAVTKGAEALYEAVKVTMGPRGRNVAIERPYTLPIVTHDGVTVAQYVSPNPHHPDTRGWLMGVDLIRQAANKMNQTAGDGTTTVTVLTYHILKEANKLIDQGTNPMVLKREVEACLPQLLESIDALKEDVDTEERLAEVATISCADPELGKLIANLVWTVGKDGNVTVEDGTGLTIESEIVEGYSFERGWLSPFFITDTKKNEARMKDAFVYISDKALTTANDAYVALKQVPADRPRILIIAEDVKKEALAYLTNLKTQGNIEIIAVKAPGFGNTRAELLKDLAILTDAKTIGIRDQALTEADYGRVASVIVGRDTTTLIGGDSTEVDVESRIEILLDQAENTDVELEKKLLKERAAALGGKVAVIRVGGLSEAEAEEKKYRVDDAVAAAKAALSDGIVAGGGVTLRDVAQTLEDNTKGEMVVHNALLQPFVQLMNNAGFDGEDLVTHMLDDGDGFDVMGDGKKAVRMKQAGIIDPAQVTKQAVQTAISVACTLMTMGALIVAEPEKGMSQDDLY